MVTAGRTALAQVDLIVAQGADNAYRFRYKNADGTAVNLTGWTAKAQLRAKKGGDIWATLTTGITLGADGYIDVLIPHATTEATAWNSYRRGVWDLELTAPDGTRTRFAEGAVTVSQDVTRD